MSAVLPGQAPIDATRVQIADPPLRAVTVHGRGHDALDRYRTRRTLTTLLELVATGAALQATGAPAEVLGQTERIVEWLLTLPAERICAVIEDAAIRTLLADIDGARRSGGDGRRMAELCRQLPVVLLGSLAEIEAHGGAWTGCVGSTSRSGTIGADVRLLGIATRRRVTRTSPSAPPPARSKSSRPTGPPPGSSVSPLAR